MPKTIRTRLTKLATGGAAAAFATVAAIGFTGATAQAATAAPAVHATLLANAIPALQRECGLFTSEFEYFQGQANGYRVDYFVDIANGLWNQSESDFSAYGYYQHLANGVSQQLFEMDC
jgi:hypothetical protein